LSTEAQDALRAYVDILLDRGIAYGLIGPREVDRIWDRHILNSLALVDLIPKRSAVVDVGSGAGLPGVPLALVRPDVSVTLLDSMLRRTTFLEAAVAELHLAERVRVVRSRAEDHREHYDVVVARAVAPLERLLGWCEPMLGPGGVLLALKGQSAADEVAAARSWLMRKRRQAEVLTVRAEPGAAATTVVRVH
jgi:16S rRNA (guanine527-N7)-methyltransferase